VEIVVLDFWSCQPEHVVTAYRSSLEVLVAHTTWEKEFAMALSNSKALRWLLRGLIFLLPVPVSAIRNRSSAKFSSVSALRFEGLALLGASRHLREGENR